MLFYICLLSHIASVNFAYVCLNLHYPVNFIRIDKRLSGTISGTVAATAIYQQVRWFESHLQSVKFLFYNKVSLFTN